VTDKKHNTILIAGYYGFGNTGDEAILSAIINSLRKQRNNLEFIVVSGRPEETARQQDVRSILWTDIPAILDACELCDLVIVGGGGLFHDYWGVNEEYLLTQSHNSISFYTGFPILAGLYKKPCMLYSVGVGPLLTEAGKHLTCQAFENATLATVRDIESYDLLKSLGLSTEKVHITSDPAFLLPSDENNARRILRSAKLENSQFVAVSLRNWDVNVSAKYWQNELARVFDQFIDQYGVTLVFIPLQAAVGGALIDDLSVTENIVSRLKNAERTVILPSNLSPETISGILAQADLVIAMRLHALIFSIKEGIPVVGLIYDPKLKNLMSSAGIDEYGLELPLLNTDLMFAVMQKAWSNREPLRSQLTQKARELSQLAEENSRFAISLLDEKAQTNLKLPDLELTQSLLLKQTRKLAQAEQIAHSLWMESTYQKTGNFYNFLKMPSQPLPAEQASIINKPSAEILAHHRPDVICFSIIDWSFRYQRPQQIMSQFAAQGHRVFYINISQFQSADATPRVLVRGIKDKVYEIFLSALHKPEVYAEDISGENSNILLAALDELRQLFQIEEAISYVMIASWAELAARTKKRWGWQVIYDCMDEWDNFPAIKSSIIEAEKRLVKNCDLLVVTSKLLFEKWKPQNRPQVLARNAADYPFYAQRYLPNHLLEGAQHPVIGYYGAIANWFDLELMQYIAEQRPNYSFVLLGGVFDMDVSALENLPNVKLLGQQPYETMPQYLYHFDVCLIPFLINPITEATDPVKVYEYMCAGKPVVSVALPELEPYKELLYLAHNKDDFLSQLDQAVLEKDNDLINRRKAFAQQNTWEQRILLIEDAIHALEINQKDLSTTLPLIFPLENLVSSRLLASNNDHEYWCSIYAKDGKVYKQASFDLAERESRFLSLFTSPYFPELIDANTIDQYSVISYTKISTQRLEEALPQINTSGDALYNFIGHCLKLLNELHAKGITHRNICRDSLLIQNGKPVLFDFCWAICAGETFFTPLNLGGSERPADGSFSDIYSMGKILEFANRHRYPAFGLVIDLMTSRDPLMRITDLNILQTLFASAHNIAE